MGTGVKRRRERVERRKRRFGFHTEVTEVPRRPQRRGRWSLRFGLGLGVATVPPLRDPARPNAARKKKPGRSGRDDRVRKRQRRRGHDLSCPYMLGAEKNDGKVKTRTLSNEGCGTHAEKRARIIVPLRWKPVAGHRSLVADMMARLLDWEVAWDLTSGWRKCATGFERSFWVANVSELFERLSYYAAFASLARYLHEALNFPTERAADLSGIVWRTGVVPGDLWRSDRRPAGIPEGAGDCVPDSGGVVLFAWGRWARRGWRRCAMRCRWWDWLPWC